MARRTGGNPAEGPLELSAFRRQGRRPTAPPPRAARMSPIPFPPRRRSPSCGQGGHRNRAAARDAPGRAADPPRPGAAPRPWACAPGPRAPTPSRRHRGQPSASSSCVRWSNDAHLIPRAAPGRVLSLSCKTDWRPAGMAKLPPRALRSFPIAWLIDCTLGHRRAHGSLACSRSFGGRRHDAPPASHRRRRAIR